MGSGEAFDQRRPAMWLRPSARPQRLRLVTDDASDLGCWLPAATAEAAASADETREVNAHARVALRASRHEERGERRRSERSAPRPRRPLGFRTRPIPSAERSITRRTAPLPTRVRDAIASCRRESGATAFAPSVEGSGRRHHLPIDVIGSNAARSGCRRPFASTSPASFHGDQGDCHSRDFVLQRLDG